MIAGVPIQANWEAFLGSTANKDELFCYLSECIQACEISTNDKTVGLMTSELALASVLTFDRLLSTT